MSKEVRIVISIVLGLSLLYLSIRILRPFWPSAGWGLLLALMLDPVQKKLRKRMKTPFWPSFLTTVLALLIILIPLSLLMIRLTAEISTAYPAVREQVEALQQGGIQHGSGMQVILEQINLILDKFGVKLSAVTSFFAAKITDLAQGFFANTISLLFDFFFTLVFTYVFLRYGGDLAPQAEALVPLAPEKKCALLPHLKDFTKAVFRGIFLTALAQGFIGFIGYLIFGVPSPLFFGTMTSLFSLIPVGGSALVWGPLGIFLLVTGQTTKGILLLVWGVVLVSGIDNLLRPLLISRRTSVNAVFVLISALGGVAAFGVIGLFLGPILLHLAHDVLGMIVERRPPPAP